MIAFYAAAAALCALAVLLLTRMAWWPARAGRSLAGSVAELANQVRQLRELHAAGALGAEAFGEASAALERKLIDAVAAAPAAGDAVAARAARPSNGLSGALALFVCAVTLGGYAHLGSPSALFVGPSGFAPRSTAQDAAPDAPLAHELSAEKVSAMIEQLAARLKAAPDDADGWEMLARSYVVIGQHAKSIDAFKQALRLRAGDPNLLADYADALAMAQQRNLDGEPSELIARALKIDPDNGKALALAGTAAFDRGDYRGALAHWQHLVATEPAGGPFAPQLQASIDEARRRAGLPASTGRADAATPARSGAAAIVANPGATPDAGSASVAGTVTLASALAARVAPDDTVFVFARAAQGSRMPLAILRKQVRDLPLRFTLDDSLAMSPQARLSLAQRVIVGARVSRSGNAMPQPGDLEGLSPSIALGATDLRVEINAEVAR